MHYLIAPAQLRSQVNKLLACLLLLVCFANKGMAQTGRVAGIVTDAQGKPIPAVTVQVKNSTVYTATDSSGHFSIKASPTDTLEFSSVGFKKLALAVGGQSTLQVSLEPEAGTLNNVIVIGYTTQRKKDLTGSVSTVNTGDIAGLPVGGVDQILQGKAAGVTITQNTGAPGDGVVVRIRGIGTINNNDPLYIIDGVPTKDGINQISPNDIESISVLKDASAASIYGARASNGVVVITTKKRKNRQAPPKPQCLYRRTTTGKPDQDGQHPPICNGF
ncbi:TonB-dependent receptor plug domain-containing protein [Paraflavitalea speifideaquila]|uniref:TonB-dependent receptor plug domain-containing protein n=1 Tax=Paraflavitalea speifideaquila TaxID=3076558 RepID=UPI0028EEFBF2|nr:TonB-dependent receptor plug domain-containing protein [Paraflavitalea speifideiaquila]